MTRRKTAWRIAALVAVFALVAAACGDDEPTAETTTTGPTETTAVPGPPATDPPTTTEAEMVCEATIGFIGPVTGPVAFIGEVQLNWFKFALDSFNTEMNYQIGFVEADNQFDTAQSATIAAQFLDDSSIVATVGPAGSDQVDASGAVFEAGDPNFTFVSPSSTRIGITDKYSGMFRTVPSDLDQAPLAADFMIAQGATTVFMVDDQSSYSVGLSDLVVAALETGGVTVIRESVANDVTDFSALVSNIPNDAEFVYLPWQVAANGQIFSNQMVEQGKNAVIVGSDGMDSDDFTTAGSYVAGFAIDIATLPGSAAVLEGFLAQYPDTNTFGPPVYVATQVIYDAIGRVCEAGQVPDRANVQAEVKNTDLTETILGSPVSFKSNGDLEIGQFFLFQIQEDGTKTLVE